MLGRRWPVGGGRQVHGGGAPATAGQYEGPWTLGEGPGHACLIWTTQDSAG